MQALRTVLSYPVALAEAVLLNVYKEFDLISRVVSSGGEVSFGMLWSLAKWGLLALLILGIVVFVCTDTVRRVVFSAREKKGILTPLDNLMVIMLTLFIYYFIISIVLYLFFAVVLPITEEM